MWILLVGGAGSVQLLPGAAVGNSRALLSAFSFVLLVLGALRLGIAPAVALATSGAPPTASRTTIPFTSRLEADRYGVPQYSGESDLSEEYCERWWDLWDLQPNLQLAAAVHLRAGVPGAAYEAVRKLGHDRLKTKNEKGEPTEDGMRLLLDTPKENRASEVPARVSELFLKAFLKGLYDPGIWRKPAETMQQYIARREPDFQHEEVLPKSSVPEQVCAMMLMTFAGRAPRSIYLAVLSSCNNEYDFKKLSHALRIQFPQQHWEVCAQARPTWMGTWPT